MKSNIALLTDRQPSTTTRKTSNITFEEKKLVLEENIMLYPFKLHSETDSKIIPSEK